MTTYTRPPGSMPEFGNATTTQPFSVWVRILAVKQLGHDAEVCLRLCVGNAWFQASHGEYPVTVAVAEKIHAGRNFFLH